MTAPKVQFLPLKNGTHGASPFRVLYMYVVSKECVYLAWRLTHCKQYHDHCWGGDDILSSYYLTLLKFLSQASLVHLS